jgi:hypothetical protein
MTSDKIRQHHLDRRAILYVRQSSSHQVLHNRESRALQYAMRERLTALGWSEIEIIDDDLGRSAAGSVVRAGFERMVAEVCLGRVGAVAAREVSRFARNSRDWQQLIEMCRAFLDGENRARCSHTTTIGIISGTCYNWLIGGNEAGGKHLGTPPLQLMVCLKYRFSRQTARHFSSRLATHPVGYQLTDPKKERAQRA